MWWQGFVHGNQMVLSAFSAKCFLTTLSYLSLILPFILSELIGTFIEYT